MAEQPEALTRPIAVLVVDDDTDTRALYGTYLNMEGFTVSQAASVREALAYLAHSSPDVVLTDFMLPDGDGGLLCSAIRATSPQTAVIALTGRAMTGDELPGRQLGGFDAVLQKPCELDDLLAAIRTVVRT